MNLLLHNGKLISESTFSGINRGLYYGDGLFETIRLIEGKVHLLDVHLKRMQLGFKMLGFESNASLEKETLRDSLLKLAAANELQNGKIRLTIYRKQGGAFIPETDAVDWLAELQPIDQSIFEINRKGLIVDVYKKEQKHSATRIPYKSVNAAFYIQAGRYARDNKLDEVLIINEREEIIESLYSNVFYLEKDQLYTPPIEGGGLPGVMRAFVIHILNKQGVEVLEKPLSIEELYDVDELFLTNSIRGIRWVGGFHSKRFYSRHIREYVNWLNASVKQALLV